MPLQSGLIKKTTISGKIKGMFLYDRTDDFDPDDLMLKNKSLSWYKKYGQMPRKNLIVLTQDNRFVWYDAETMKPWFNINLNETAGSYIYELRMFMHLDYENSDFVISAKNGKLAIFNKSQPIGIVLDFARDYVALYRNNGIYTAGAIASELSYYTRTWNLSYAQNATAPVKSYTELKGIQFVKNELGDEYLMLMGNNGSDSLVQYFGSMTQSASTIDSVTTSYNITPNVNFSAVSMKNDMVLYSLKNDLKVYFKMQINNGYAFMPNIAVQTIKITDFTDITASTSPLDPTTNEIESIGFDYSFDTKKLHVAVGLRGEYDPTATGHKYINGGAFYFIVDMVDFTIKNQNYVRLLSSNYVFDETQPEKTALILPSQFYTGRIPAVEIKNDLIYIGATEFDYNAPLIAEDSNKGGFVALRIAGEDNLWDATTGDLTLTIEENYTLDDTDFVGDAWTLNDVWDIQVVNDNDFVVYTPAYFWMEAAATVPPIKNFERAKTKSHSVTYTISLENKTKYAKIEILIKENSETEFRLDQTVYLDSAASVIPVIINGLTSDTQYNVKAIPYSVGAKGAETSVDTFTTLVEFEQPQLSHSTHDDTILLNIDITDTRISEIDNIEIFRQLPGDAKPFRIGKVAVENNAQKVIPLSSNNPDDEISGSFFGNISYLKLDYSDPKNKLLNGLGEDGKITIDFADTSYHFTGVKVLSVNYESQIITIDPTQINILETEPIDPSVNQMTYIMDTYVYEDKGFGVDPGTTIMYYAKLTSFTNESLMTNPHNVPAPDRTLDPIFIKENEFWRGSLNFNPESASLYEGHEGFVFDNKLEQKPSGVIMDDTFGMLNAKFPLDMNDFEISYPADSSNFQLVNISGTAGDTSLVLKSIPIEVLADRMGEFLSNGFARNMEVLGEDPINSHLRTIEPTMEAGWNNILNLSNETIVRTNMEVEATPINVENFGLTSPEIRSLIARVYKIDTTNLIGSVTNVDFANDSTVVIMTADEFITQHTVDDASGNPMLQLDPNSAYKFEFQREIPVTKMSFDATHVLFGDHEVSGEQTFTQDSTTSGRSYSVPKPDFGYPGYQVEFEDANELYTVDTLPAEKQFELHFNHKDIITGEFNYKSYTGFKFGDIEPKITRMKSMILKNNDSQKALIGRFNSGVTWSDVDGASNYTQWRARYWYNMSAVEEPMTFTNESIAEVIYTHNIVYTPDGATESQIETHETLIQLPRSGATENIGKVYTGLENSSKWSIDVKINKIFIKNYNSEIRINNINLDSMAVKTDENKGAIYVKTINKAVYNAAQLKSIKQMYLGTRSKEVNGIVAHTIKYIFSADNKRWYYLDTDTRTWVEVMYGTNQTKTASNTNIETSEITYEEWADFFNLYDDPQNFYLGLIYLVSDNNGPFPGFESANIIFEAESDKEINSSIITPVFKPPRASKLFDLVIVKDEPKGRIPLYDSNISSFIRYSSDNGRTWNTRGWIAVENTADIRALPEFENLESDNLVYQMKFDFKSSISKYPTLRKVDLYMMDVYKMPELVYPALGAPISDQDIDVVWLAPENLVEGTEHFAIEVATKDFDDPTYSVSDRLIAFKSFEKDKKPFRETDGYVYDPAKFSYSTFYTPGTSPEKYTWKQIMGLEPGIEGVEGVNGVPADGENYVRFKHTFETPVTSNKLYFRVHVWDGSMGSDV